MSKRRSRFLWHSFASQLLGLLVVLAVADNRYGVHHCWTSRPASSTAAVIRQRSHDTLRQSLATGRPTLCSFTNDPQVSAISATICVRRDVSRQFCTSTNVVTLGGRMVISQLTVTSTKWADVYSFLDVSYVCFVYLSWMKIFVC